MMSKMTFDIRSSAVRKLGRKAVELIRLVNLCNSPQQLFFSHAFRTRNLFGSNLNDPIEERNYHHNAGRTNIHEFAQPKDNGAFAGSANDDRFRTNYHQSNSDEGKVK